MSIICSKWTQKDSFPVVRIPFVSEKGLGIGKIKANSF